jgi:hypothetical protein
MSGAIALLARFGFVANSICDKIGNAGVPYPAGTVDYHKPKPKRVENNVRPKRKTAGFFPFRFGVCLDTAAD